MIYYPSAKLGGPPMSMIAPNIYLNSLTKLDNNNINHNITVGIR